jgi:hypothetical protein
LYEVAPATVPQVIVTWLLPAVAVSPEGIAGRGLGVGGGVEAPPPPQAASSAVETPAIHKENHRPGKFGMEAGPLSNSGVAEN